MQERKQLELRVGLFLNLGIALVTVAVLLLGAEQSFITKSKTYKIILDNAAGLGTGAKVLIGGIQAGSVESLDLSKDDRRVKVRVSILDKYENAVRGDTEAELTTEGLLGDKVLSLNAGDPQKPIISEGGTIPTRQSTDFAHVVDKSDIFLTHLNELTVNLNHVVEGFSKGDRSKDLAIKLNGALTKLDSILGKVDDGQGSIGALVNDPELYDDAKRLVGETNNNRIVRNLVHKTVNDADAKEAQESKESKDAKEAKATQHSSQPLKSSGTTDSSSDSQG
jgi:phospholipid/cholesterol/gamma-HCH transport system substrate-binding protein